MRLQELLDQAWGRVLDRDPVSALRCGRQVDSLPRGGPEAMLEDVALAQAALDELATLDTEALPDSQWLDAEYLRDHLRQEVAEAQRFWYRFPVTPYNAYPLSAYRTDLLAEDTDRFLALLNDYAGVVEQIGETMHEQRRRGIRLPRWAVGQAVETVRGHAEASSQWPITPPRVVEERLAAAFGRLLADLAEDAVHGGDGVGIGQYPGGAECYAGLIGLHTGLDLSAEEVHAFGLAEVERIGEEIGEEAESRPLPMSLEGLFQAHLDRLRPHLPHYFSRLPAAPFRLRPLEASLDGLTYGFYEPPGLDGVGYFHFNRADLAERYRVQAASVIYHEGLPGHHLQMGLQL